MGIIIGLLKNAHDDAIPGKINIADRGASMYRATCAATYMTSTESSLEEACRVVDAYFLSNWNGHEDLEIWFGPDTDYFASMRGYLDRERPEPATVFTPEQNLRYATYQQHLSATMRHYAARMRQSRLITVDAPGVVVQNHLRGLLRSEVGLGLSQIGDSLDTLVAFSGMSESGKSSHAEHLRREHHFCRLKLKHFVANLTREGVPASAIEVALELLRYLCDHYYLDRVSIESLHAPYLAALLKRLLGERLRIVYICAPPETRVRRSMAQHGLNEVEASAEVAEKDHRKISCGVEQIRAIADIVWDNSQGGEYASTTVLARRLLLAAT